MLKQYVVWEHKVKQEEYIANRYVELDVCSRGNEAFCSELLRGTVTYAVLLMVILRKLCEFFKFIFFSQFYRAS